MMIPVPGLILGHQFGGGAPYRAGASSYIIDAVGESVGGIGYLRLTSGRGTTRSFGGAGSSLSFCVPAAAVTWADVTSRLRVGIQAVSATTAVEDGVWLVYGELSGGDGSIVQPANVTCPMTVGTLNMTDGQLYAVVVELTVRGGTDSVRVGYLTPDTGIPYTTQDSGTGPARTSNQPQFLLTFADGTYGYLGDETSIPCKVVQTGFDAGDVINEYATVIRMPFSCEIDALYAIAMDVDNGDDAVMTIFRDPFSAAPIEMHAPVVATGFYSGAAASTIRGGHIYPCPPLRLDRGNTYAIAYRATATAANRVLHRTELADAGWRKTGWLGESVSAATRGGGTGAFTESLTQLVPTGAVISQIDINAATPRTRIVRSL